MTDKNNFADGVGGVAADDGPPHAHPAPERRRWVAAVLHRWPTWLAIAMAAALAPGSTVGELAGVLPLLAFGYLAAPCSSYPCRSRGPRGRPGRSLHRGGAHTDDRAGEGV